MYNTNLRIKDNATLHESAIALCEDNPGAASVLVKLMTMPQIDPDAATGPFSNLLLLDSFGIYGSNIWVLYKNICDEDIVTTVGVLRAVQLGFLKIHKLIMALDPSTRSESCIDTKSLLEKVRKELPLFIKPINQ